MDSTSHTVVVKGHVVTMVADTVETGGWCDQCALPSVITLRVRGLCDHGVRELGTVRACDEHGAVTRS